ncbi:MAG TPA: hypothetical protein P5138_07075 [Solirubrobacterales bacterium]|nr:hypothetical protein [Solirubrobacterales bacterium]
MPGGLPFIDEHSVEIEAEIQTVWDSLIRSFGSATGGGLFALYGRAIGVEPLNRNGVLDEIGSTQIGFRVSEAFAPELLVLRGRHRFSNYSLTWRLAPGDHAATRLSAITHAEFPGIQGRIYKALVIDSGTHGRVTRRMLSSIARQSTRT